MTTKDMNYWELKREVERLTALVNGDFKVTRLLYEMNKPTEIQARGAMVGQLAACCRDLLADATNYVELKFEDDLGKLAVVIQKLEGESPADKAARLGAALERANKLLGEAADEASRLQARITELEAQP